tara:strand:+ start:1865 stop:2143 length:279 start_codon:yes stop_codon:yes gene_type:complete
MTFKINKTLERVNDFTIFTFALASFSYGVYLQYHLALVILGTCLITFIVGGIVCGISHDYYIAKEEEIDKLLAEKANLMKRLKENIDEIKRN